jgi:hypothetical protein
MVRAMWLGRWLLMHRSIETAYQAKRRVWLVRDQTTTMVDGKYG